MTNPAQVIMEKPAANADIAPLATIKGQAITDLPKDLYIPPDAMKVFLKTFEGPLDFLLYLIRKQNIDILDIPIASVTKQYMEYIDIMQDLTLELAAEYLVMAAILAEIKSRMLLPRQMDPENPESDPRILLVERLKEYERFKRAAEDLDQLQREERDTFNIKVDASLIEVEKRLPDTTINELLRAYADVMKRVMLNASHQIQMDTLSVREKMTYILELLQQKDHYQFTELFSFAEGRLGVVVTFLAFLELLKQGLLEFVQASPYAPIYVQHKSIQTSA